MIDRAPNVMPRRVDGPKQSAESWKQDIPVIGAHGHVEVTIVPAEAMIRLLDHVRTTPREIGAPATRIHE